MSRYAQGLVEGGGEFVDLFEVDDVPQSDGLVLAHRDYVHLDFVEINCQYFVSM